MHLSSSIHSQLPAPSATLNFREGCMKDRDHEDRCPSPCFGDEYESSEDIYEEIFCCSANQEYSKDSERTNACSVPLGKRQSWKSSWRKGCHPTDRSESSHRIRQRNNTKWAEGGECDREDEEDTFVFYEEDDSKHVIDWVGLEAWYHRKSFKEEAILSGKRLDFDRSMNPYLSKRRRLDPSIQCSFSSKAPEGRPTSARSNKVKRKRHQRMCSWDGSLPKQLRSVCS